jgi:hypothetical protein
MDPGLKPRVLCSPLHQKDSVKSQPLPSPKVSMRRALRSGIASRWPVFAVIPGARKLPTLTLTRRRSTTCRHPNSQLLRRGTICLRSTRQAPVSSPPISTLGDSLLFQVRQIRLPENPVSAVRRALPWSRVLRMSLATAIALKSV